MTVPGADPWRPALWLRSLVQLTPAPWPTRRAIRAAIAIGAPLLLAQALGDVAVGMWVSMGCLLLAVGERAELSSARFRRIAVSAPIAAAAYFLGWLSEAPPVVALVVMSALAFGGGILSGASAVLSIATMQGMLIGAIAIGVPQVRPYWPAALLFLVGAALYAALLAIEMLLDPRQPQRAALVEVLSALAEVAEDRASGGADHAAATRAASAIDAYQRLELVTRSTAQGPTREYDRAGVIVRAADQLLARLLAHDVDRGLCRRAGARLREDAAAYAGRTGPETRLADGTLVRLAMLEDALWTPRADVPDEGAQRRPVPFHVGRDLVATAGRLALCTAAAYALMLMLPIPRGYWIALTVALVMKPDLGSIFARGVLRAVGSVVGAGIAVVIGLSVGEPVVLCLVVAALGGTLPWAASRSYALQALVLTPLIMVLLSLRGGAESILDLAGARVVATLIGSATAIVLGYLIWPSARHAHIEQPFRAAMTALVAFASDIADGADSSRITLARRRVYALLGSVRVSVQRTLAEPPPAGREAAAWIPVVASATRVADRLADASASRPPRDVSADREGLASIAARLGSPTAEPLHAQRRLAPPPHGGESPDPLVRELADEVAALLAMLERQDAGRAPVRRR